MQQLEGIVGSTTGPTDAVATTDAAEPTTTPARHERRGDDHHGAGTAPRTAYEGAADPFTLGVGSGEPQAESVVLWTRLLPDGEAIAGDLAVEVEVASDTSFSDVVLRESPPPRRARERRDHVAAGLAPATTYAYRFRAGPTPARSGETMTAPAGAAAAPLRLAAPPARTTKTATTAPTPTSPRRSRTWSPGSATTSTRGPLAWSEKDGAVRTHGSPEPTDLPGYRARYALYKRDADLQAAHAACPWIVIWDDHEVENNYAGDHSQDDVPTAAHSAPAAPPPTRPGGSTRRPASPPTGADYRIYRAFEWGSLAHFVLLDTRQYRTDQACGDVTLQLAPPCPDVPRRVARSPATNRRRGSGGTGGHEATWNVIAPSRS